MASYIPLATYEVALRLSDASPVYYRYYAGDVEIIDPETGDAQTMPIKTFKALYCTMYQPMPDNLRAKARAVPSFREWQAGRSQTGGNDG